jgi:hypothetical protein
LEQAVVSREFYHAAIATARIMDDYRAGANVT